MTHKINFCSNWNVKKPWLTQSYLILEEPDVISKNCYHLFIFIITWYLLTMYITGALNAWFLSVSVIFSCRWYSHLQLRTVEIQGLLTSQWSRVEAAQNCPAPRPVLLQLLLAAFLFCLFTTWWHGNDRYRYPFLPFCLHFQYCIYRAKN